MIFLSSLYFPTNFILFVHLVEGHIGWFEFLAIMNNLSTRIKFSFFFIFCCCWSHILCPLWQRTSFVCPINSESIMFSEACKIWAFHYQFSRTFKITSQCFSRLLSTFSLNVWGAKFSHRPSIPHSKSTTPPNRLGRK